MTKQEYINCIYENGIEDDYDDVALQEIRLNPDNNLLRFKCKFDKYGHYISLINVQSF